MGIGEHLTDDTDDTDETVMEGYDEQPPEWMIDDLLKGLSDKKYPESIVFGHNTTTSEIEITLNHEDIEALVAIVNKIVDGTLTNSLLKFMIQYLKSLPLEEQEAGANILEPVMQSILTPNPVVSPFEYLGRARV